MPEVKKLEPQPCPFCDSRTAVGFGGWHPQNMTVCCTKCGASGPIYNTMSEFKDDYDPSTTPKSAAQFYHTYNKAVDAWNSIAVKRSGKIPEGYCER